MITELFIISHPEEGTLLSLQNVLKFANIKLDSRLAIKHIVNESAFCKKLKIPFQKDQSIDTYCINHAAYFDLLDVFNNDLLTNLYNHIWFNKKLDKKVIRVEFEFEHGSVVKVEPINATITIPKYNSDIITYCKNPIKILIDNNNGCILYNFVDTYEAFGYDSGHGNAMNLVSNGNCVQVGTTEKKAKNGLPYYREFYLTAVGVGEFIFASRMKNKKFNIWFIDLLMKGGK